MESFTITRDDRTYDVAVIVDDCPMNPRTDYDHDATRFYVTSYGYSRWEDYVDELSGDDAGAALAHFIDTYRNAGVPDWGSKVERAFHLWTVITGSPVVLVTGESHGYSQGDWHLWFALVDTAVMERDGYSGTPREVAENEAGEYAAYAYGDVYGAEVTAPSGESESSWGIVDRDHYGDGISQGKRSYVREVADELVDGLESDWREREAARVVEANRVGSGFIGVI